MRFPRFTIETGLPAIPPGTWMKMTPVGLVPCEEGDPEAFGVVAREPCRETGMVNVENPRSPDLWDLANPTEERT